MPARRIDVKALPPGDGGGVLAWVPDLPGCLSDGETAEEVVRNCRDAIGEWIDHAMRCGEPVPSPSSRAYA